MDAIRDHCMLGGALGSLLSILRFRIDSKGVMNAAFLGSYGQILATFGFNGVFAFLFSPLACDVLLPVLALPRNQSACVALSGAIAWACPWLVLRIFPTIGKKLEGALKSLHPKTILERLLRLWDQKG